MDDRIEKLALVVQQLSEVVKSQQGQINMLHTKLDYQHITLHDHTEALNSLSEIVKNLFDNVAKLKSEVIEK